MANPLAFTKQLAAASSNAIATSQSPGSAALTLTSPVVTIDTASALNSQPGRRVILTSGGNDSGINWTVFGTGSTGNSITDTFAGSNGGAAQSNLDFVTVTKIVPSGAVATTVIAGTNGVASSPWFPQNWIGFTPMEVAYAIELVSGAANFTVQHTYDDPNNLPPGVSVPLAFNSPLVNGASATADGAYASPITAIRLFINSGTGALRMRILQAGVG